jgi:hypothetical protein
MKFFLLVIIGVMITDQIYNDNIEI